MRSVLRWMFFIFNSLLSNADVGTGEAKGDGSTVPGKRGTEKEDTMKTSILMKIVAALDVGAAFPLGAIAAPPAKAMTERGVIEKVNGARNEFMLKGGLLKRTATFEWNASTRFVEKASRLQPPN